MTEISAQKLIFVAGVTMSAIAALIISRRLLNSGSAIADDSLHDTQPLAETSLLELQVVDLTSFITHSNKGDGTCNDECKAVAKALCDYGIVIIRDNRVSVTDNDAFIDMMERYYASSDGIRDARPQYHYQVGVTPSRVEHDPKWRFFWRMGPVPEKTNFPLLNMDAVIPQEIPEWSTVMDAWGYKMLNALNTVSEMAALGFDLPADTFTKRLLYGPHLLAPTGSDYTKFNKEGTVLAGYHYDLNFLTIHGKSRYPGLYIWTKKGKRVAVSVPEGCLLIQAGKQMEYLTGGHVIAGYHEVIISAATTKTITERKNLKKSLWRISSTLFGHIQSDQILEPLAQFSNAESIRKFPRILAGDQVREELQAIQLDTSASK